MRGATLFTVSVTLALAIAIPTITPNPGDFSGSGTLAMHTTSGPSIDYTTNVWPPTQFLTLYTGAMTLASNTVVNTKAFKSGSNPGGDATASFSFASLGIAKGVIRYADNLLSSNCTSGNYSIANRNCTGSDGNGYISLQAAANASTGDDTIRVRGSATRYTGSAEGNTVTATGTSASKLTIEGYQSERPMVLGFRDITFVHIRNLIVDANKKTDSVGIMSVRFSLIEGVEVRNAGIQGLLGLGDSEFINLNVHHNGFNPSGGNCGGGCHGAYTGSDPGVAINNLFDGGEYHHNNGYGIQCYNKCDNTIIRNLRVHHNGVNGLIAGFNAGIKVYNVVADNNGSIGVHLAGSGLIAANITAYNNRANDIYVSDFDNQTLRNSIALPNGISTISGTTTSNNISGGRASAYFVDAPKGNFQPISKIKIKGLGADLRSLNY